HAASVRPEPGSNSPNNVCVIQLVRMNHPSKNSSKMTGSYMCDAHALAFNTLLSSQETDAYFLDQIRPDLASEALSRLPQS
ncbi:hypothetical protein ABZ907_46610, partial [Nonomuraea wenchangensis]